MDGQGGFGGNTVFLFSVVNFRVLSFFFSFLLSFLLLHFKFDSLIEEGLVSESKFINDFQLHVYFCSIDLRLGVLLFCKTNWEISHIY